MGYRTMSDEIIKELWQIKESIAREHGYDVGRFIDYIRSMPRPPGQRVVDLSGSKSVAEGDAGPESQPARSDTLPGNPKGKPSWPNSLEERNGSDTRHRHNPKPR